MFSKNSTDIIIDKIVKRENTLDELIPEMVHRNSNKRNRRLGKSMMFSSIQDGKYTTDKDIKNHEIMLNTDTKKALSP